MVRRSIQDVLKDHTDTLMAILGVAAVAVGELRGKACIRVFVTDKSSKILRHIPNMIEDYAVLIDKSGQFQALDT